MIPGELYRWAVPHERSVWECYDDDENTTRVGVIGEGVLFCILGTSDCRRSHGSATIIRVAILVPPESGSGGDGGDGSVVVGDIRMSSLGEEHWIEKIGQPTSEHQQD